MFESTVATLQNNESHGEDNFLVCDLGDHGCLDAVMDGVTDRRGSDASELVGKELATASPSTPDEVVNVLNTANGKLFRQGWGRFMLTTAAVALCVDNKLFVIGVGDSPVFLIRPGEIQRLVSRTSGFMRAGIARAVGIREELGSLYRVEFDLQPGDRLVVATDGVTDSVTDDELAEIVLGAISPDDAATRVEALIAQRQADGHVPASLGGRFRLDDRTAIFRFFGTAI